MKSVPLNAYPRTSIRRTGVKKLRAAARIPAVIYGRQRQPQPLELKLLDLEQLLHHSVSENILVDVSVEGDAAKRLALVQEIQHHPLSGKILHVDLHEVSETERVTVQVPVETYGDALGVKEGGVLEHVLFRLRVRCLPKDLPEAIRLDVSHLVIGKAIHIGDITPPPGTEILGDKQISVVAVAAPVTEEQEAAAAEAAAETALTEPEVLKEKKEEGEAGAEKGAEKGAAKGAEKAPAKGAEKAPAAAAKGAEKAPAKGGEKAPDKKK